MKHKNKKVKVANLDLDELKSIYINMAKEAVSNDKDCSQYIFNESLKNVESSLNRLNDLVKYSKERQANKRPKRVKK